MKTHVALPGVLLLACSALLEAPAQTKQHLRVERIFQKPSLAGVSVSDIKWSPDGSAVAYLRADASSDSKDLWLYDVSRRKGNVLLRARDVLSGEQKFSKEEEMVRERTRKTDAGITAYIWSPDGKKIFIPLNGEIFGLDVASRKVTQLTQTPEAEFDPKVSPAGEFISYVRNNELYVRDLNTGIEKQLSSGSTDKIKNGISEYIAQEEMDRTTGYWWAPDGKHISYLRIDNSPVREFHLPNYLTPYTDVERQEYPKAGEPNTIVHVGVVAVDGGPTTWLDAGSNADIYVCRVDWLPDGKRLAVQLQSRNQDTLDLVLYDIESRSSRRLIREVDPRWVSLHNNLTFLKNKEQFLWSSERDGFQHLYLYSLDGKMLNRITNGRWEVDRVVAVNERNGIAYFTSTEKSPTERHLYQASLDGSNFTRMSTGSGWHDITMSPDCRRYVTQFSSATRPPVVSVVTISTDDEKTIEENRLPDVDQFALGKLEFFTITAPDGQTLHALMMKPASFDPARKYPVIVYVYGGPTAQVVADQWGAGGGWARSLWHRSMAERGYIVFSLDGRGTPGRGREFQDRVHKRLGDVELRDQLHGVAYLKSLPYVDSSRIMIWGKSYGGFMACMAMFTTSDVFTLGISVAPVTDWRNYDTHYTERYLERPQENPEGYRTSSPVTYAKSLKNRFLLIHGVADDNVHFQDSMTLVDELQSVNKQFEFMAYPRSTHSFSGDVVGTHLYALLTRYITENL